MVHRWLRRLRACDERQAAATVIKGCSGTGTEASSTRTDDGWCVSSRLSAATSAVLSRWQRKVLDNLFGLQTGGH